MKLFADEEAIETLMVAVVSSASGPAVKLFADEEAIETSLSLPTTLHLKACETVR